MLGLLDFHVLWPVLPVGVAQQRGLCPYHNIELLPIVLGVAVWGSCWHGCTVKSFCYSTTMLPIVNWGRSKMYQAMHLTWC